MSIVITTITLTKSPEEANMGKERFQSNPYPGLEISQEDQVLLLRLTNSLIRQHFKTYESFVLHDKRIVDKKHWKHVKSRRDMHVYVGREEPQERKLRRAGKTVDVPVMLTVGEFTGKMNDHMLGLMNPTVDTIRMKASYVHDVSDAAVLASLILPTMDDPFFSVVVKWMQLDLPLESTNLIKNRDFVYIEATGFLRLANREQVGYHLMHSIDFPETRQLSNVVRGNLSICCMFRQLGEKTIDYHSVSTFEPGGDLVHFLVLMIAADRLLSATNHEPYGQTMKLAWVMKKYRRESSYDTELRGTACTTCMKKISTGKLRGLGSSSCKICFKGVCRSCRIRKRISMVAPDGKLLQSKVVFCALCIEKAPNVDAEEVARDLAVGYNGDKLLHFASVSACSSTSDCLSESAASLQPLLG